MVRFVERVTRNAKTFAFHCRVYLTRYAFHVTHQELRLQRRWFGTVVSHDEAISCYDVVSHGAIRGIL